MELLKEIEKIHNNIKIKKYDYAIEKCNKLIRKFPSNAYLYNLGGLALQQFQNITRSVDYFQKAIQLEPKNIAAKNNLANSLKILGKFDLAEKLYKEIIDFNPRYIKALNNYANLKQQINNYQEAILLYEKALQTEPNNITVLMSLASAHQGIGNFNKAKEVISKILKINPKIMSAHKLLSSIVKYKKGSDNFDKMINLTNIKDLEYSQKIDLYFALAKAYEDVEDYELSYKFLKDANEIKRNNINYNLEKDEELFKSIKKSFKNVDFRKHLKDANDKQVIFICGMPRSGTTLTEQILASHKKVSGAGELIYLQQTIKNNYMTNEILNGKVLEEDIHAERTKISDEYFGYLKLHNFKTKIITDKAPQNFRWLGFIKIFFPNSKIVHCKRNSKDICLSLFKNSFASTDMNWTYSQKEIAKYYNMYEDLMKFWNDKFSDFIYDINYENLVKDKEKEIKKLLDFCNLDHQDDCFNHHRSTKTPIKTVSVTQARMPIYSNSINKNEFYKKNLNQMFRLLNN